MRFGSVVLGCGLAACGSSGSTPDPSVECSTAGGRLVFGSAVSTSTDDQTEVWTAFADGSNATLVAGGGTLEAEVRWAPDGSRIYYTSHLGGGVSVFQLDDTGANPVQITPNDGVIGRFEISPDGTRILYEQSTQACPTCLVIHEIAAVGTGTTTPITIVDHQRGSWSPDGSRIAHLSNSQSAGGVFLANADGTNPQLIFSGFKASAARFSPDGTKVAYFGDLLRTETQTQGNAVLNVFDLGSMTATTVWEHDNGNGQFALTTDVAWSPDSTQLAFSVRLPPSGSPAHVLAVPAAGGTAIDLGTGIDPAWSLDGTDIYFSGGPILRSHADGTESMTTVVPIEDPRFGVSPQLASCPQ